MKRFINASSEGVMSLFFGDSISLYAYLSIVLIEIFHLWSFKSPNALAFTVLLLTSVAVICLFGVLKRVLIGRKAEFVIAVLYWVVLAAIFLGGCFVDWRQNIYLFLRPALFAFVWIMLRNFQKMKYVGCRSLLLNICCLIFSNCLVMFLAMIFVALAPFALFFYWLCLMELPKNCVIAVACIYAAIMPILAYFEERVLANNIFAIGYSVVWSKNFEYSMKSMNLSLDVFTSPEFIDAFEEYEATYKQDGEKAEIILIEKLQKIQTKLEEEQKKLDANNKSKK